MRSKMKYKLDKIIGMGAEHECLSTKIKLVVERTISRVHVYGPRSHHNVAFLNPPEIKDLLSAYEISTPQDLVGKPVLAIYNNGRLAGISRRA